MDRRRVFTGISILEIAFVHRYNYPGSRCVLGIVSEQAAYLLRSYPADRITGDNYSLTYYVIQQLDGQYTNLARVRILHIGK
jgi:hypothetical protein